MKNRRLEPVEEGDEKRKPIIILPPKAPVLTSVRVTTTMFGMRHALTRMAVVLFRKKRRGRGGGCVNAQRFGIKHKGSSAAQGVGEYADHDDACGSPPPHTRTPQRVHKHTPPTPTIPSHGKNPYLFRSMFLANAFAAVNEHKRSRPEPALSQTLYFRIQHCLASYKVD